MVRIIISLLVIELLSPNFRPLKKATHSKDCAKRKNKSLKEVRKIQNLKESEISEDPSPIDYNTNIEETVGFGSDNSDAICKLEFNKN